MIKKIFVYSILFSLVVFSCAYSQNLKQKNERISKEIVTCADKTNVFKQLDCFVSLAIYNDDVKICDNTKHEGVKYQCYAMFAERTKNWNICKSIPNETNEHKDLRSVCISDVAEVVMNSTLCDNIETPGIKDSCYLKVFKKTKDPNICEKIKGSGLKSLCTGEPYYIE